MKNELYTIPVDKNSQDEILIKENANMKRLFIISFVIFAGLVLSACGAGSEEAAAVTPIPTVVAENVIVAEGRL